MRPCVGDEEEGDPAKMKNEEMRLGDEANIKKHVSWNGTC